MSLPAKDTVMVVGGLGNCSGRSTLNGGGATKAAWDAGSPSDFIGANGAPVDFCAAGTIDTDGGNVRITDAGSFTNVVNGAIVLCIFTATYASDRYEVLSHTDNSITIDLAWSTDVPTAYAAVGGAVNSLQEALDLNDGVTYNRFIYISGSTAGGAGTDLTTTTIKADTYGGSASSKVFVIGYNITLTAEATVAVTTTTDLTGEAAAVDRALLSIVTVDYLEFRNIDFDGGGKDNSQAMYGLYAAAGGDGAYSTFYNCQFHAAESSGAFARTGPVNYIKCLFYLNGGYGLDSNGSVGFAWISQCLFADNDLSDLYWRPNGCVCISSLFYDNGKDAGVGHGIMHSAGSGYTTYIGNTIYGNFTQGFCVNNSDYDICWINNAYAGNGDYGIHFGTMGLGDIGFFGFNLSGANTTGDYYFGGGAGTDFTNFANGSNVDSAQTADALFKTLTDNSEDFTPETGSDLIDAQLEGMA